MTTPRVRRLRLFGVCLVGSALCLIAPPMRAQTPGPPSALTLAFPRLAATAGTARTLQLDGLFVETTQGRVDLAPLTAGAPAALSANWSNRTTLADGRVVTMTVTRQGDRARVALRAQPVHVGAVADPPVVAGVGPALVCPPLLDEAGRVARS